jgi:hypothetical protein
LKPAFKSPVEKPSRASGLPIGEMDTFADFNPEIEESKNRRIEESKNRRIEESKNRDERIGFIQNGVFDRLRE